MSMYFHYLAFDMGAIQKRIFYFLCSSQRIGDTQALTKSLLDIRILQKLWTKKYVFTLRFIQFQTLLAMQDK